MLFATQLAVGCSLLSFSEALNLQRRTDGPARVLQLDTFRKRSTLSPSSRDKLRKRASLQVALDNEGTLYFANVSMGTPPQKLRLDIDTGSSDLWTNSAASDLCTKHASYCTASGTYNANDSSTYQYVNSAFLIKYADGSYAQGDYGQDTLSVSGTSISGVQFGIGYSSTSAQGILGVGYKANEAAIATTGRTYDNVPALMASQGIIQANAYSLWLNDLDANTGSILFGGVDTEKYHGSLNTLPIIKESNVYQEFIIALTSVAAGGQTVSSTPVPVLLDSGSSLTYLPDATAQAIFKVFSATYDSRSGAAVIDCALSSSSQNITFSFSSAQISVPLNELILLDGYQNRRPICILGISSAGSSTAVLGDTFLRSAYVVYDLGNNQISLAQTNFNATASNVQEIRAGASGVPNATPVQGAISSLAVGTGAARGAGNPSVTAVGAAPALRTPIPAVGFAAVAAAGLALVV